MRGTAPNMPNAFWWQWPCTSARLAIGLERQLEPSGRRLAHQKLLEHQRVQRKLLRAFGLDHRRHLVAEAKDAARLQPDHRHAALHERRDGGDHALRLAPRLIDPADRQERAAAAERALRAVGGLCDVHRIAGCSQNRDGGVEVLALEIAVEGIGEEHDLAAILRGPWRCLGVSEHILAPLRQRARAY